MADGIARNLKASAASMLARIQRLLLKPSEEFARIADEPQTITGAITSWVMPLVALMVIINLIVVLALGIPIGDDRMPADIVDLIPLGLPVFVMSSLMPLVMGAVIAFLAKYFGGVSDFRQAVRTAAYAGTASWLVGIFGPIWRHTGVVELGPAQGLGTVIGMLWSTYLLFRALPPMMKAPQGQKSLLYTVAIVAVMLPIWIVVMKITFAIVSKLFANSYASGG